MTSSYRSDRNAPAVPLHELTGLQRDLLCIVCAHGSTESTIVRALEARYGTEFQRAQIRSNLTSLERRGYVRSTGTGSYDATPAGDEALEEYVSWITHHFDSPSDPRE